MDQLREWRETTAYGSIALTGRLSADKARPVLFVIRGIFPGPKYMDWLADELADEADVVLAHLPGMQSPTLVASDLATITAAFRELLDGSFAGRKVVLFGTSTGALVALGLARHPPVMSLVLLEPFLRMETCWALREIVATRARPGTVARAWCEALLGAGLAGDFRPLIGEAPTPTHVIVGDVPLDPPRPMSRLPSFTSDEERALWQARPGVELTVCADAGHNIPEDARPQMLDVLRRAIAAAI